MGTDLPGEEGSGAAGLCVLCGSHLPAEPSIRGTDLLHGVAGEFAVHVCPRCGAGNTRPRASDEELARFYPDAYGPHASKGPMGGRLGRALAARELRVGAAGALGQTPGGRLLDVGCGDGELGELMSERGWRVDGIEPSAAACERARARGVAAVEGTLDTVDLEPGVYDAIVFNHSLEHIPEPVRALTEARKGLRALGLVGISVPNFDSWGARRFGREWFHLDLPRHRVHFTAGSLRAALGRAGLEPERTWTTTSPSGLIGSVQYRRMGGLAVSEGPSRQALGQIAGLALIPAARAEQALGGGRDFLHAVARRSG
jgi:SAM-dependent methyltransferase